MSDMSSSASIHERAAYWAERLDHDDVTDFERREFRIWVLANRAHEAAYLDQALRH